MEYSLEQLNYFRICYVGINLVPVGLRQIFRNEWDFLYKTTPLGEWKDTSKNGSDFYNNESRSSRRKNARYLATIQNGNTTEWDCTSLFFAILYSDTIGTTLSAAVYKDVDDLRQVRNDIAHISEAKLTDADFQNHIGKVVNAFISLGLSINDTEDVKHQTTFPTEELKNLRKEVRDLKSELDQAKSELNQTKSDLDQTKNDLNQTKSDLDQTKSDLDQTENYLNHTKSDLEVTKNILQRTQADLFSAKDENKALTQEKSFKTEPFCFLALKPPHEVIRRSSDIERLSKKMEELHDGSNGAVSTIYLSGNPGCGKTQLARQLGQEFFSDDMTFVATLNAESIEALADSYITLGRHLGITEYALTNLEISKREKPGETMQQIQRLILPKCREFAKWLIIADNVIDLSLVRTFLPQTGSEEWGHGQVLITTQDSTVVPHNVPHTHHESFSKGMRATDAVELLEKVSQISDREQTEHVATVLDYQPLALAAAAYYVQTVAKNGSPEYSWAMYVEGLSQRQREATENVLASESVAYSKTTTSTVKMAVERAIESDEVLRHSFSFFALCAFEVLPVEAMVDFVKARITDQSEELIKAKILRSSLILSSTDEEEGCLYLGLHNIVHSVLKRDLICKQKSTDNIRTMAVAVTVFSSLLNTAYQKNWALLKKLISHCKSLLEHMTSNLTLPDCILEKNLTLFITVEEVVVWLEVLAKSCIKTCDFSFVKYVVDIACSLQENLSNTKESALLKAKIFSNSGIVYRRIEKNTQAKEFHEKALTIDKSIYGEENSKVAVDVGNLASVYLSLGEYNQARELYGKALLIQKKIFGDEHAHVATSYNNLATVYNSIGDNDKAKELYEKAQIIRKNLFLEETVDAATTYCSLGDLYCDIGDYNQAKEVYEKALMIRRKILGEEHPEVAASCSKLATLCLRICEYNQAKELFEKALWIEKKTKNEGDSSMAFIYNQLGVVYRNIGDFSQAKELHQKALVIDKKVWGEENSRVATSYGNLGGVYLSLGEYNQARELYEKALLIRRKILGDEHAHVATSYNNLAAVYSTIGNNNKAKELYEKAQLIRKNLFLEETLEAATTYQSLGDVYRDIGDYDQAKEVYEKALMIKRKILGEEHPEVAASCSKLAILCLRICEYNQAKELFEKVLWIEKKTKNEGDSSMAFIYNQLGVVYRNIGDFSQAKELHQKALVIDKKVWGEENSRVATSYGNLGGVYLSLGEYNQARELYEKALLIQRKILGDEHAHVATSYNNLAAVYSSIGNKNKAKELYEKAQVIRKNLFLEETVDAASTYCSLGDVYSEIGDYNQAKDVYEKSLMITKKILGEDNHFVRTLYERLATLNEFTVSSRQSSQSTQGEYTDRRENDLQGEEVTACKETVKCVLS